LRLSEGIYFAVFLATTSEICPVASHRKFVTRA